LLHKIKTFFIPFLYKGKNAKNWVSKNLKEQKKKKPKEINFVIDVNGEDIGSVGFSNICEFHKAEIGDWLAEKYWNNGIMTEAIKIATKFGFDKLKLKKIYAPVFSFNKASMRVFEKNNYKLEGILKKNVKKGDKLVDDYFFAKIK